MYRLEIAKEAFKFSASHFALFGPACAERMHGHNYYVRFFISATSIDDQLGMAVEFNDIKPLFLKACQDLDEYILVPEKSPYLAIKDNKENIDVVFNKKYYSFPSEDVKKLPLLNISVEELSYYIWQECLKGVQKHSNIVSLGVEVQETRGQKCLYESKV